MVFIQFIPPDITRWVSVLLFLLFGLKMLHEAYKMSDANAAEEMEEVQHDIRKREDEVSELTDEAIWFDLHGLIMPLELSNPTDWTLNNWVEFNSMFVVNPSSQIKLSYINRARKDEGNASSNEDPNVLTQLTAGDNVDVIMVIRLKQLRIRCC